MYFKSFNAYFISSNFFIHMVLLSVFVNYNNPDLNCYYFLTIYSLTLHIKVRVKSKLTIPVFILLAHIAIFVVSNSSMQGNPQKKCVCLHNL